jgi:hypothetical protein
MPELLSAGTIEATLVSGDCDEAPHEFDGFTVKSLDALSQIDCNSGISAHERLSTRNTTPKNQSFLTTVL